MNLFIDTNIYLTFYHFTSDDLEELKKLIVAVESNKTILFIPQQVIWEFRRNREARISDALKKLNEQIIPRQFPQICKGYEEFKDLTESVKDFERAKDSILQQLDHDIKNNSLKADRIIADLFAKAKTIELKDNLLTRAKRRSELGNPPGKRDSYGDAINWEMLIDSVPNAEDLYLITDDKDYISQIDTNNLSEFLVDEWKKEKGADIFLYRKLSDFFRDMFPEIRLASELELEKELAISSLVNSATFGTTHLAIKKLSKFTDFSDTEINELVKASISNSQIYWIKVDEEVKTFFKNLVKGKQDIISDPATLEEFNKIYKPRGDEAESVSDEIPF